MPDSLDGSCSLGPRAYLGGGELDEGYASFHQPFSKMF